MAKRNMGHLPYSFAMTEVTNYIKQNFPEIEIRPYNAALCGPTLYIHGVLAQISPVYAMSIQGHAIVAGGAFVETALLDTSPGRDRDVVYDKFTYGNDVLRHGTPEDFMKHFKDTVDMIKCNVDSFTFDDTVD